MSKLVIDYLQHANNALEIWTVALIDQRIHKMMGIFPRYQQIIHVATLFLGQVLVSARRHAGSNVFEFLRAFVFYVGIVLWVILDIPGPVCVVWICPDINFMTHSHDTAGIGQPRTRNRRARRQY